MAKEINLTPQGDTLTFREGAAAPIFTYEGFRYTANSTPALIALVKSKSVKENCVIAYDAKGFKAILNDKVIDRRQDRVAYEFQYSLQYEEWQKILENGYIFDQKNLIDFLKRREYEEIEDVDQFICALQNFKFVTNITGDFSFDDRNNYTFAIKVGDAEGTVKLPQIVKASIEIFNESGFCQDIEIELEVKKPKGEGEKPLFALACPKLSRYLKAATDYEIGRVKQELDGYLIVAGNI
jgi:hypothetical protein